MHQSLAATLLIALFLPNLAQAGFGSSSFRKGGREGDTYYQVASALDGDLGTCWMVDPELDNVGQWFEIGLPASTVSGITLAAGWERDEETFSDYPRLKKAKIQVFIKEDSDKPDLEQVIELKDVRGLQSFPLTSTKVGAEFSGGRVRVIVEEVYPGADYPTLGIAEARIELKEQDIGTTLSDGPTTAAAGHAGEALVDKSAKTFWLSTANEGQALTIGASDWGLSSLGVQAGPKTYARPKTIQVRQGLRTFTLNLANTDAMQWLPLPPTVGYNGSSWGELQLTITEVYPGTTTGIAITELALRATTFSG